MKGKIPTWVIVLVVVVIIVIFILSVGLLKPDLGKKTEEETEEEKERKHKELQQKVLSDLKKELEKTNKEIAESEEKLIKISGQEKLVLFACRVCIGAAVIAANIACFSRFGWSEKDWIGDLIKYSSFFVACYSFVAFITHGTPAKFAAFLKSGIRVFLKWWHRTVYQQYEVQKFNRELTTTLILAMEKPVEPKKPTPETAVPPTSMS